MKPGIRIAALMLMVACVTLQACNTRRVTRSQYDESRYHASRTDIHLAADSTTSTGTETTTLVIEFDTGGTMTLPQGWLEGLLGGMVSDSNTTTADNGNTAAQVVTVPKIKTIAASHTKRTEQTATSVAADVAEADTTTESVVKIDSTGVSRGETAITGKSPSRFAWWLAVVLSIALILCGIYIGLKKDKRT